MNLGYFSEIMVLLLRTCNLYYLRYRKPFPINTNIQDYYRLKDKQNSSFIESYNRQLSVDIKKPVLIAQLLSADSKKKNYKILLALSYQSPGITKLRSFL